MSFHSSHALTRFPILAHATGHLTAAPTTVMLDASRVRLLDVLFKERQELHRTGWH